VSINILLEIQDHHHHHSKFHEIYRGGGRYIYDHCGHLPLL